MHTSCMHACTADVTQVFTIDKEGQVCLSIPSHDSPIRARWASQPGSNDDCTCPAGPRLEQCSCIVLNKTTFTVDYNKDLQEICWKNLTEGMNNTKFFLFIDNFDIECPDHTQLYLIGAEVHITNSATSEPHFDVLVVVLTFLLTTVL